MLNLFLQNLAMGYPSDGLGMMAAILAMVAAAIVFVLIVTIILWLYMSFAYMAIAKKAKLKHINPGIAFIPVVGPAIIASKIAKMHWWPILLLIGIVIIPISLLFVIAFTIFMIVWMWKTFEAIKKPGWWAILMIIPIVNIIYLVLLGVAAWSRK
ncbi:MAG: hypothetical protein WC796_01555 [Candidatus Pacearchaeota archaeon]|jgi:hypothetical protein